MNIDSQELQHVQQTAAAQAAARYDIYAPVHKALRALMADTLLALGRMDTSDELELFQTAQRVFELLEFCGSHLKHENQFIHTAMQARAPGSSERIAGEHVEHDQHIQQLSAMAGALFKTPVAQRAGAVHALYQQLSLFVAHNFEHMQHEETVHNAVLWAHYSDAELAGIEGALVASIPPDEMMVCLRWMVPFMNPAERTTMLAGMLAHAPAPAFAAAMDTVRPHLTDAEWAKLTRSLGLAAVPGLVQA